MTTSLCCGFQIDEWEGTGIMDLLTVGDLITIGGALIVVTTLWLRVRTLVTGPIEGRFRELQDQIGLLEDRLQAHIEDSIRQSDRLQFLKEHCGTQEATLDKILDRLLEIERRIAAMDAGGTEALRRKRTHEEIQ